jgi:hypothetical protein
VLAQHGGERLLVEQVDVQELDGVGEMLVARVRARDDADDLVAALEQELGEIRAVLPAYSRDQCLQSRSPCRAS